MKKLFIIILIIGLAAPASGAIWAEIYKGKVWALHDTPDDFTVEFAPESFRFAKDVTNLSPQPQAGWTYDMATDQFSSPSPIPQNMITSKAFFLRFTISEREAFTSRRDSLLGEVADGFGTISV